MKIRMDVNGTRVTATLDDNATSRDFIISRNYAAAQTNSKSRWLRAPANSTL
jgi:hypothetical protein